MADPVSISSALVGAISLAIPTCQGTVKYYNSFKDVPEDIARIRTELGSITTTLEVLRRSAKGRHVHPDTKAEVERLITRALDGIDELRRKLDKFWAEDLETGDQAASEMKETNKETNGRRNRLEGMPRHFKKRTVQSMDRIKYHSNRTIDRARYPFREETIRKLQDIIYRVKVDLTLVMPVLSNDAANGTLNGMDALNKGFEQIHKDVNDFRKQANDIPNQLRKAFDDLQLEIRLRDSANRNSNKTFQIEYMDKAESLQEGIKDFQRDFNQTKQKLLNEVHGLDARMHSTGRAVGGVHDQLVLTAEQLTEDIKTTERNSTQTVDQVASDVNVWREEMTRSVHETSGAVRTLQEEVVPMQNVLINIDQHRQAQEDASFLEWLSPLTTGFEDKQSDTYNLRCKQEGAAKHFLQSKEYLQWIEGLGNALWCLGGPGVGKTVLTSSIVQRLQQDRRGDEALVYIYCDHSEAKKHEPSKYAVKLLAHILRQLASNGMVPRTVFDDLRRRYASSKASPGLVECRKAMIAAAAPYSKIFFVLDALDECSDTTRDVLFEELKNLEPKLCVIVTSRCKIGGLYNMQRDKAVSIRALDSDIAEYVKKSTKNFEKFLAGITDDKPFQERIVSGVVKRANGMFLLAKLHLHALVSKPDDYSLEATLNSLPDSLGPTYDEVIERIEERDPYLVETAKKLITWVSLAERPLTIEELRYALAIEPGDAILVLNRVSRRATILKICPELLELQGEDTLRFVHYSAQEHFAQRFGAGHSLIALSCLSYLSFEDFDQEPAQDNNLFDVTEMMESQMAMYPLLEYACCHWGHHAKYTTNANVRDNARAFCEKPLKVLFCIEVIAVTFRRKPLENTLYWHTYSVCHPHGKCGSLGLWIAAYYGWHGLAVALLNGPMEAGDREHAFPLAVSQNHKDVVMLFLEHGADVNAKGPDGQTALHHAVKHSDQAYALELLDKGAEIGITRGDMRHTALHLAARQGDPAMVQLLLDRVGNSTIRNQGDFVGNTILHLAMMSANVDTVNVILQYGAEVNTVNHGGETPLQRAMSRLAAWSVPAIYTITDILIDNGAKVNARDRAGQSALHFAAFNGDVGALDRLRGYGACIDEVDQHGRTALCFAAGAGHREATAFLIEHGAQVNTQNYEKSALWEAIYREHMQVIDTLLKYGADVNQLGLQGDPLLVRLIRYGILTTKVAEQLLSAWADPNIADLEGLTALDYAKSSGNRQLVDILIEYAAKASGKSGSRGCQLEYKPKDTLNPLSRSEFRRTGLDSYRDEEHTFVLQFGL